ncbi:sulfotransferase family protein [Paenirhodobacter hankyongi]|nr:sulfotransferase family protein [Sinirhodobacter hankyongi]
MVTSTPRRSSPPRIALVVLGMHRSGTSALAGALGRIGCDLPKDLMPPTAMNEKGFFESSRITALNDEILRAAGRDWASFEAVPADWYASPEARELQVRAGEALVEEFGRSYLFVLKDPRICRLLPFWQKVLEQSGCQTRYVMTHRDPREVAASLQRGTQFSELYNRFHDLRYGAFIWLRHVLEAEAGTRGQPRAHTSYNLLMRSWQQEIGKIGKAIGISWPRSPATSGIAEFLSGGLRHFEQTAASGAPQDWMATTLGIMTRWSISGEDQADHAELDRISDALKQAEPVLAELFHDSQTLRQEQRQVRAEAAQLTALLHTSRAEAESHQVNHATEQSARGAAEQQLVALSAEVEGLRAEAEGHRSNHATEQRARGLAEQRVAGLAAELDKVRAEAENLRLICPDIQERLARALAENADLRATHQGLEEKLERLEEAWLEASQRADSLQSALAQRSQETEDLYRTAAENLDRIAELDAALERATQDNFRLDRRCIRDSRHLEDLTRCLSRIMEESVTARLRQGQSPDLPRQD